MTARWPSTDIPTNSSSICFTPSVPTAITALGSGNAFMETISPEGFDFFTPQGYDKIYREGRKVLMNILDIEAPLIAAVNGPARLHSEYILLADIVLATPPPVFQDKPHLELGVASG